MPGQENDMQCSTPHGLNSNHSELVNLVPLASNDNQQLCYN